MKSVELLETIGEVRNEYIQDILIPPKEETSTRRRTRLPFSLLVAVMIFSSLIAATAYASDFRISDWFQSLFGELTPGQSQVLDGMGMDQNIGVVSATSNGNSVTVVSAFGDSYNAYLRLRFEGKDATDLTHAPTSGYSIYHEDYVRSENAVDLLTQPIISDSEIVPEGYNSFLWEVQFEDIANGDESLDVILHIELDPEGKVRFDDNNPETITIPGLWYNDDILLEGPWVLTLGAMGGESVELDVKGKPAVRQLNGIVDNIKLNRIIVSSIGVEVDATFDEPVSGEGSFTYPTTVVVLKDGSCISGSIGKYGYGTELSETTCKYKLYFDVPVDLEKIDYVQFCDLILPVSGDGTVNTNGTVPQEMLRGTHVVLGDPTSLRLNNNALDCSDLDAWEVYNLPTSQRSDISMYAEYTDQGVQFFRYMDDGRLAITVTDARIVTDISQLGGSYAGFSLDAYVELEETGWAERDYPICLNKDGSFKDGYSLILVDLLVENQGIEWNRNELPSNNTSIYGFNTGGFLTLALLEDADGGNLPYSDAVYFSDSTYQLSWVNYYEILPGETKAVSIGFLITPEDTWDLSMVRGCNTSGNRDSVFIDLNLN